MTGIVAEVAAQLRSELGAAAHRIAVVAGPAEAIDWERTVAGRCDSIALVLAHGGDDEVAEQVIDVMNALWPNAAPEDCGQAEWWRTPVGRLCARSLGHADAEAVTFSVAAAMLGVAKGTVSTLVDRGRLDRHPDGGVLRASVLQRLAG